MIDKRREDGDGRDARRGMRGASHPGWRIVSRLKHRRRPAEPGHRMPMFRIPEHGVQYNPDDQPSGQRPARRPGSLTRAAALGETEVHGANEPTGPPAADRPTAWQIALPDYSRSILRSPCAGVHQSTTSIVAFSSRWVWTTSAISARKRSPSDPSVTCPTASTWP